MFHIKSNYWYFGRLSDFLTNSWCSLTQTSSVSVLYSNSFTMSWISLNTIPILMNRWNVSFSNTCDRIVTPRMRFSYLSWFETTLVTGLPRSFYEIVKDINDTQKNCSLEINYIKSRTNQLILFPTQNRFTLKSIRFNLNLMQIISKYNFCLCSL